MRIAKRGMGAHLTSMSKLGPQDHLRSFVSCHQEFDRGPTLDLVSQMLQRTIARSFFARCHVTRAHLIHFDVARERKCSEISESLVGAIQTRRNARHRTSVSHFLNELYRDQIDWLSTNCTVGIAESNQHLTL